MIFVKISQFYQISLKNLPYLTDFSPQLMACMYDVASESVIKPCIKNDNPLVD